MARAPRDLDDGAAAVLIVASLSRLGRSTRDVLDLAARADANGWALAILDLNLDTATPTGRFTLTMLAAVAQLEHDQTSERTAAALAAKKAQGHRLGRPASTATRLAGARALDLRADGLTWRAVAQALTDEGYTTREGVPWHPPQRTAQPAPSPSTAAPPTNAEPTRHGDAQDLARRYGTAATLETPATVGVGTPLRLKPAAVTRAVGAWCAISADSDPIRPGSPPTVATIAPRPARAGA